jgi:hypothetical protein
MLFYDGDESRKFIDSDVGEEKYLFTMMGTVESFALFMCLRRPSEAS